ncbi:hypothetical protein [Paraburkholderia jirisanensis]
MQQPVEQALIRSPIVLFVATAVTCGFVAAGFPQIAWLLLLVVIVALANAISAAFFVTRYTTWQLGTAWMFMLNFWLFIAIMIQVALDAWVSRRVLIVVTVVYFVLLEIVYLLRCRVEARQNWKDFGSTLTSLVVRSGEVRRVRAAGKPAKSKSSSGIASMAGGSGVAALGLAGAVFGPTGKQALLLIVVVGFMAAPFFVMRYLAVYGVGIREVRKAERQRGVHFSFDNVDALQEARRKILIARWLNPRLREAKPTRAQRR